MTFGRAVASVTASLAVAGCAVVAVGMGRSDQARHDVRPDAARPAAASPTARPAFVRPTDATTHPAARPARVTVAPAAAPSTTTAAPTTTAPPSVAVTTAAARSTPAERDAATPTRSAAVRPTPSHTVASRTAATRTAATRTVTAHRRATHAARPHPSVTRGRSLPLGFTTGNARKVITVVAHSHHSTTATLQAWTKASGGGWVRHGSAVTANVGSDGLTKHASESRSATPIGSFTLTRAFGHDSNPGTSLPYVHTTPADWWISQAGKLYNTLQVCSSHCAFNQGSPNEHLYYETPYYDYAVVIDYNTRNAPGGVHQGRGSAFFLHVRPAGTGGTAGCVDIPKSKLKSIMRWLTPQSRARILIGVR